MSRDIARFHPNVDDLGREGTDAYQVKRHKRIAALACIWHNAGDRDDFLLIATALGLDDLIPEQA